MSQVSINVSEVSSVILLLGGPEVFKGHYEPSPGQAYGNLVLPEGSTQEDLVNVQNVLNKYRSGASVPPLFGNLTIISLDISNLINLDQQKEVARVTILSFLNSVGGIFTSNYSQPEIQSWTLKEGAARAYMAKDTLTDSQTSILNAEKEAGNYATLDDLVLSIVQKADVFASISGFLSGVRSQTFTAIDGAANPNDLINIFNNMKSAVITKVTDAVK